MKVTISIELDDATGKMAVFAQMETAEQRETTAMILAQAVQIVLQHRPKRILPVGGVPGVIPAPPNGKVN